MMIRCKLNTDTAYYGTERRKGQPMRAKSHIALPVYLSVIVWLIFGTAAIAGPEVCGASGGPTICVRFDNRTSAPENNIDYVFDFDVPSSPSVRLLRGENPPGALYGWRVWSKDAQGAPANIGSITSPGEYNYSVKIANPTDEPGAANLSSASLTPLGDHYSIVLPGSRIGGDLTNALVVQSDTIPDSGTLSLTIDGNVSGNITAPRVLALSIGGDVSGSVSVGKVLNPCGEGLEIGGVTGTVGIGAVHSHVSIGGVPGSLSIQMMGSDFAAGCAALVNIQQTRGSGNVSGIITVDSMGGPPGFEGGPALIVEGTVTSTGSVTVRDTTGNTSVKVECNNPTGPNLPFDGTITLEGGIKDDQTVFIWCNNDSTGTLDLNNQGVSQSGSLDFHTGGPSTIRNGGVVAGFVEIGNTETPVVPHVFAGTATFQSVESGGVITTENCADLAGTIHILGSSLGRLAVSGSLLSTGKILVDGDIAGWLTQVGACGGPGYVADGELIANADGVGGGSITGVLDVNGTFNGNICGDNLSPMEALPENISIADFGDDGTLCGARPGCGTGTISGSDPADGTRDARQPHPLNDCSLSARQGIGSAAEPIVITLTEGGANNLDCWALCETGIEEVDTGQGCGTLEANAIKSVTEMSAGVYEIVLNRPISAGHWTTVSYLADESYVSYASLPGNSNGDGRVNATDLGGLRAYILYGGSPPPYGIYGWDLDHNGLAQQGDIDRWYDLANGVSTFIPWRWVMLPVNTCPGGGDGFATPGGDDSDDGTVVDDFMEFFTTYVPAKAETAEALREFVNTVAEFAVKNLSASELKELAGKLDDPALDFASDAVRDVAPQIVAILRR